MMRVWLSLLFVLRVILGMHRDRDGHPRGVPLFARPFYGNEYQQYLKYIGYTSVLNSDENWRLWTDCINKVSVNFRNSGCTDEVKRVLMDRNRGNKRLPSLFKDEQLRALPMQMDCEYDFVGVENAFAKNHIFSFKILQRSCKSDSSSTSSIKGGSSFEIKASSAYHSIACASIDHFNNNYTIHCPFFELGVTTYNLSIMLDFEHYDAFSDFFAPTAFINKRLFYKQIRVQHGEGEDGKGDSDDIASDLISFNNQESQYGMWTRDPSLSTQVWASVHRQQHSGNEQSINSSTHASAMHQSSTHILNAGSESSFGALADYHWLGTGTRFLPSRSMFKAIFGDKVLPKYEHVHTHLVGASHMRYTWDLFYYLYYSAGAAGQLERKHGYADNIARMVHEGVSFATDLGDYFTRLTCPGTSQGQEHQGNRDIYVFQTGTWDLTHASLRNLLHAGGHAVHLAEEISNFAKKCSKSKSEGQTKASISLIWVSPPPYPRCTGDQACLDRRHYNNRYASVAFNQAMHAFLESAISGTFNNHKATFMDFNSEGTLSLLQEPPRQPLIDLDTVDSVWTALPRVEQSGYVCMNHFLCHQDNNDMLITTPGLVIAKQILHSILHQSHSMLSSKIKKPDYAIIQDRSKEGVWYLMQDGVVRKILDQDTIKCLNATSTGHIPFIAASTQDIQDYPLIELPLPSRKEGKVLKIASDRSHFYQLRDCHKYRVKSSDATSEPSNVNEMDLYDIPTL